MKKDSFASIPMRMVGPIKLSGPEVVADVKVPLATFETPLWPSVARGAKISRLSDGIKAVIVDERMSRSILLEAPSVESALDHIRLFEARRTEIADIVESTSRFARLIDLNSQLTGRLIYLRIEVATGDASGHNMATKAADRVANWLLDEYPDLQYESISANYCTDKKVSAVNGILGRGKYVSAEIIVPQAICRKQLRVEPSRMERLNVRKNLVGSTLAGSLRSANAHFANMLLAFYIATGQDAANIVEGSQGITTVEEDANGDLYFAVTLPNLVVGTVGNGKDLEFVRENMEQLACLPVDRVGQSSRRLAIIAAATVLCGELSLLAALCNSGELMRAHEDLERRG